MLSPLKITLIIYAKSFYSAILRYHFMIPMEIYSSKKIESRWDEFWDAFS